MKNEAAMDCICVDCNQVFALDPTKNFDQGISICVSCGGQVCDSCSRVHRQRHDKPILDGFGNALSKPNIQRKQRAALRRRREEGPRELPSFNGMPP